MPPFLLALASAGDSSLLRGNLWLSPQSRCNFNASTDDPRHGPRHLLESNIDLPAGAPVRGSERLSDTSVRELTFCVALVRYRQFVRCQVDIGLLEDPRHERLVCSASR